MVSGKKFDSCPALVLLVFSADHMLMAGSCDVEYELQGKKYDIRKIDRKSFYRRF